MILVTGSTGFIGQLLVKKLSDKGHKLRAIVRKKSKELSSNIEQFEINLEQWVTDDASSESLSNAIKNSFEGVDVLIHMAAQPLVRLSYKEPVNTYTTNVIGTVNVLEASRTDIPLTVPTHFLS